MAVDIKLNAGANATYGFNASRLQKVMNAGSLDEAQRMGLWDGFKDRLRGGVKADAIRQLYESVAAPQPHEAGPPAMLDRFYRLKSMATDEASGEFAVRHETGVGEQSRQWTFSLEIGGTRLYGSPALDDTAGQSSDDFVERQKTYEALEKCIRAATPDAAPSAGTEASAACETFERDLGDALADGFDPGAVKHADRPRDAIFNHLVDRYGLSNPFFDMLRGVQVGDTDMLARLFPKNAEDIPTLQRIEAAKETIDLELVNAVIARAQADTAILPTVGMTEFAHGRITELSDDKGLHTPWQFLRDHLEDPLYCSANFKGIEPSGEDGTFKAVFQREGEAPAVLMLSNRKSSAMEFRGEIAQDALRNASYAHLKELLFAGFRGSKDAELVGSVSQAKYMLMNRLELESLQEVDALLRDISASPAVGSVDQLVCNALRDARVGNTNLLAVWGGEPVAAAALPAAGTMLRV